MKIGFDGKRVTHNFRGLGNYSRGIIEGLIQYNPEHSLYLYTPQYKNQRAINWISNHPQLNIRTPETYFEKILPGFWRSFLLDFYLSKDALDIYHGLSHEIPKLPKNRKYKTVVTIHDLIFLRFPEFFPWIDRKVYYQKFKYAIQNADLVLAICEQTKNDIIQFFNTDEKKIRIHYQSAAPIFQIEKDKAEIDLFKKNHQLFRPYILNVGAFEERKNQKAVVETFNQIHKKFDIDLVFVGQGKNYLKEVKNLVQKYHLENRVHFLNAISFQSLPTLYQGAELFFFPSFFEGFGIPIVEALFSKIPVVTSIGSCFPESAGPNSIFIDPNQLSSMVDGVTRVLENSSLKNQMITEGLKYSEQFSLKNTNSELVKIYQSLI